MIFLAEKTFCADTANIWYIIGVIVNITKIVIPLILIILGMIDIAKAVISNEDKSINKAALSLLKRVIAAVVMFLIPTLISMIFNLLANVDFTSGDTNICLQCLTNVYNGEIEEGKTCEYYKDNTALGK